MIITKKYAVDPRFTLSKNDGQEHYVSASQLIGLYGVNPRECIIVTNHNRSLLAKDKTIMWLRPRQDGKYTLKTKQSNRH